MCKCWAQDKDTNRHLSDKNKAEIEIDLEGQKAIKFAFKTAESLKLAIWRFFKNFDCRCRRQGEKVQKIMNYKCFSSNGDVYFGDVSWKYMYHAHEFVPGTVDLKVFYSEYMT